MVKFFHIYFFYLLNILIVSHIGHLLIDEIDRFNVDRLIFTDRFSFNGYST